jgi:hypothetical protein
MADVFRTKHIGGDFDDSPVSSNKKIPQYGKETKKAQNRLAQDIVNPPYVEQDIYSVSKGPQVSSASGQQSSSWQQQQSQSVVTGIDTGNLRQKAQQGAQQLKQGAESLQEGVQEVQGQVKNVLSQLEYVPPPASIPMIGEILRSSAEVFTSGLNNLIWWSTYEALPGLQRRWYGFSTFWGKAAPLATQEVRHLGEEVRPAIQGTLQSVQPMVDKTTVTAKHALQQGWDGICSGACYVRDEICEGACYLADRAAVLEGKAVDTVKNVHLPSVHLPSVQLPSVQLPDVTGKVKSVLPGGDGGATSADIKTISRPVQAEENAYQQLLDRVVDANTTNVVSETIDSAASTVTQAAGAVKQKATEVLPVLQQSSKVSSTTGIQEQQEVKKTSKVVSTGQPAQPHQLREKEQQEATTTTVKTVVVDPGKTNVDRAIRLQKAEQ